jgi:hypothetical protein
MNILEDDLAAIAEASEVMSDTLDFDSVVNTANWQSPGEYYQNMPALTRAVIDQVVEDDLVLKRELREAVYPEFLRTGEIKCWERANPKYINQLQQKRLYPGKVVCADATVAPYNSRSLIGAQIGVSRVGYQGGTEQFVTNLLQWGIALPRNITARDVVNALRSRGAELKEKLSNVFIYTISLYMERRVLLDTSPNTFKLIQGTAFPYEMLVGSGRHHTMQTCLNLLGDLIDDGNYACIVSNDSHRDLLTFGIGLEAGEYIVTAEGTDVLEVFLKGDGTRGGAHYTDTPIEKYRDEFGNKLSQKQVFSRFQKKYGPKVVQGILRAHKLSAPYIFYCNAEKLHEAVHLLLADAEHTGARGFPLLVDLADQYCSGAFRAGEYTNFMNAEFARASGGSVTYQSERTTRDKK